MAKIDVTLGTLGRHEQFCKTIKTLNKQTFADKMFLYIMDGNDGDNSVSDHMNSKKWSFEGFKIYKDAKVIKPKQRGRWAVIYNYLMQKGNSKYVTFWSDDVFPDPDCFEQGIKGFVDDKVGAVAFKWRDGKDGTYTVYGTEMYRKVMLNFGLIRRRVLEKVRFLDDSYSFYNADQDLSLKIWYVGFKVVRSEGARVTHFSGLKAKNKYRSGDAYKKDCRVFTSKWAYDKVRTRSVRI